MKTLQVEYVVTEKCNLACEYCYMKNTGTFMDIECTLHFIENVHKVMEIYGCDNYHISYFGGEPLLNWNVVKESIKIFNKDKRCSSQVIISNGLLLDDEKTEFIKSNGVGFSFSFDGLWQNENRPHVSHEDVLSLYMEKWDVITNMIGGGGGKVMVAPQNIDTMTENFEFFVEKLNAPNPDFSLVRDDIWSDEDIEKFKVESRRLADRVIRYYNEGTQASVGFFDLYLADLLVGKKYGKRPFGCFAGCSGVGYLPDKQFYLCARYGSASSDKSGLIMDKNGNLYRDLIDKYLDPAIHNPVHYEECKNCRLYNYCNAGCTYSQVTEDVDGNLVAKPVESVCKLFHILYDDVFYIHEQLKDNNIYQNYIKTRFGIYL